MCREKGLCLEGLNKGPDLSREMVVLGPKSVYRSTFYAFPYPLVILAAPMPASGIVEGVHVFLHSGNTFDGFKLQVFASETGSCAERLCLVREVHLMDMKVKNLFTFVPVGMPYSWNRDSFLECVDLEVAYP